MKGFLLALGLVATIAVMAVLGWQASRTQPGLKDRAALELELQQAQERIAELEAKLAESVPIQAALRQRSTSGEGATAAAGAEGDGTNAAAASGGSGKVKAPWVQMMKDPAMREMMKGQQRAQLGLQYNGLIDQFALNEEEREHFLDLLLERQMLDTDMGLALMDTDLSKDERQAIQKEHKDSKAASTEAIRQFLNHEGDFQAFEHWEDTNPERIQYEMFGRSLFASSSEPLTPEQESQLINTMTEVRKLPAPEGAVPIPGADNPTPIVGDDQIEGVMSHLRLKSDQVMERAASFLTPAQLETLAKLQEQQVGMAEMGMKMGSAMMGGETADSE